MYKNNSTSAIYKEVAKKLGLKYEYVWGSPTKRLLFISNAKKFFLFGAGPPGFYPEAIRWNAHFTGSKLLTQKILKRFGYKVIASKEVRITDFKSAKALSDFLVSKRHTFPLLIKPDKGHDGIGVTVVETVTQLVKTAKIHFSHKDDFLMQPVLLQNEYRILVINGKVMLMHSKHNDGVVGDGTSTITQLLSSIKESKKDPVFIKWQHKKLGTKPSTILKKGILFEYHLIKQPSAVFYKTKNFPTTTKKWALKLAEDMSSPVVGIDVFIKGDFNDTSSYTIIELNTNPAVYYLPRRCNDKVTAYTITEKVLRDYFKIK